MKRKSLSTIEHMVRDMDYPGLPKELEPYHAYLLDGGHSIMAVLEMHWKDALEGNPDSYELPIPVKYVLQHGYRKDGDYLIVNAAYDPNTGLMVDEDYTEY
ncbi:hypothetical protein [Paenibacillus larvae]|uniref:hypothetical protein n=1 Tax=Paenibacillus larvae TaxID=1464 RepID=UPI002280429E|nr:hypothetical protein [Paenibacillus larvae]MCY9746371.1 hypothetical protein [Paenibacillus larvae]MCY9752087.1 hypothetical protein [Paenibacillus larvae]